MPWFPDFVVGVELARRETQEAGRADPVMQYFTALNAGDASDLETAWPGEVVIYDPRAGEIRGHRELRRFVKRNKSLLAERQARTETMASTDRRRPRRRGTARSSRRRSAGETSWPVAVVVESPDDRSVIFRTYCSQWPVDGQPPSAAADPGVAGHRPR